MAFPAGPYTNGQTHTEAGVTYTYNSTIGGWLKPAATGGTIPSTRAVTAGGFTLLGGGTLAANRTFQLEGDVASPGADKFYGSGPNDFTFGWRDGPKSIIYGYGSIGGTKTYTTGTSFTLNNFVDGGVPAFTQASGTSLTLAAGRHYTIDAFAYASNAEPPKLQLLSMTTGAVLLDFWGHTSYTFIATASLAFVLRYTGTASLVNPTGGVAVYSL